MLGQIRQFASRGQPVNLIRVSSGQGWVRQYPLLVMAVFIALCGLSSVLGQPSLLTENQIIAQLIYKFSKATKSPGSDQLPEGDPYVIGIWGPDIFDGYLDQLVRGKEINGRTIRIARVSTRREAASCQVLFLSPEAEEDPRDVLNSLENSQVVTMGKGEDFADRGGMFGFLLRDGKVRYEINERAAQRERIVIHSYVLKNAVRRIGSNGDES